MVINAAMKRVGGIFAETVLDKGVATRVLIDEGGDVVDEAADDDQLAARGLVLLLDYSHNN